MKKGSRTVTAYLALGSNLGDRMANIEKALAGIRDLPGTALEAVSSIMETPAEGFDGPEFLNCCCRITTDMSPLELLGCLKDIERATGRRREGIVLDDSGRRIYSDREIDIDILLYGDRTVDLPQLQIPHPRMYGREFVIKPLNEIKIQ